MAVNTSSVAEEEIKYNINQDGSIRQVSKIITDGLGEAVGINKIAKENLGFFHDILKLINTSNRPLIIFPQGTRLLPEERTTFKKGAARIYEKLKIPCQPIAINSGFTWPKKGLKKTNSNLTISILKPIEAGLDKKIFLKKLENDIYSELDILN